MKTANHVTIQPFFFDSLPLLDNEFDMDIDAADLSVLDHDNVHFEDNDENE